MRETDPYLALLAKEQREEIRGLFETALPSICAKVLRLRMDGMTVEEIAIKTGMHADRIRQREENGINGLRLRLRSPEGRRSFPATTPCRSNNDLMKIRVEQLVLRLGRDRTSNWNYGDCKRTISRECIRWGCPGLISGAVRALVVARRELMEKRFHEAKRHRERTAERAKERADMMRKIGEENKALEIQMLTKRLEELLA